MSWIVPVICLSIVAADLLFALRRGLVKTTIRLLTMALSALLAFFVAQPVAAAIGPKLAEALQNIPEAASLLSSLESQPGAGDALNLFVKMLVAPLLFLVLYVVFKLVTLILYGFLAALFGRIGRKHRLLALLPGALCALIGVTVFLVPVMGYLEVCDRVLAMSADFATEATSDPAADPAQPDLETAREQYLSPMLSAPVVSDVYDRAGRGIFQKLSGGKIGDEETDLLREIGAISNVVSDVSVLRGKEMTQYGETEAAAVSATVTHLSDSPMLKTTLAGILSSAAKNWKAGEPFFGIEKPEMGSDGDVVLSGFLTVFETTDSEKLPGDLTSFSNIFNLMVEYRVFERLSQNSGEADFLVELQTSGFLAELEQELENNPRMQPIKDAIYAAATRALIEKLGASENFKEACEPVLTDLTAALRATPRTEEGRFDLDALSENVTTALEKHDIVLPEKVTELLSQGVDVFFAEENLTELTDDDVMNLISEFLVAAGEAN